MLSPILAASIVLGVITPPALSATPPGAPPDAAPGAPPGSTAPTVRAAEVPNAADHPINEADLMATLAALPVKRSPHGSPEHVRGLIDTEELILSRLRAMGYEPTTQDVRWALPKRPSGDGENGEGGPRVWRNIIADIPGSARPREVLILGAHFDAVPQSPGADDNGTGTAALLEIARALRDARPQRTIRMIFFNLEEVGLVGSHHYASDWLARMRAMEPAPTPEGAPPPEDRRESIVGMVSLEMLGYFTDEPGSQQTPIRSIPGVFEAPTVGDFIAIAGIQPHQAFSRRLYAEMTRAQPALKVGLVDFLPIPAPDLTRSDHAPFWLIGQPAVMLTDTANFRNPHYHQPSDTVETIDAARFTLVTRALHDATLAIAGE